MGCKDKYHWNAYHPECESCPRYLDDCDGDLDYKGEEDE